MKFIFAMFEHVERNFHHPLAPLTLKVLRATLEALSAMKFSPQINNLKLTYQQFKSTSKLLCKLPGYSV